MPWRGLLVVCLGGVLAIGGWFALRWYTLPARVTAALPSRPPLADWAALENTLAEAEKRASVRETAVAAISDIGRLYHANGFDQQAEACWRFLRREQPREARWCHLLADLRRAASDYAEMESLLLEVVRLAPKYPPAWLKWGDYALKTGRVEEARIAYGERLALVPADRYALLGLARIALLSDEPAQARLLIERIVRDHPRFSPAQNLLAEVLSAAGDTTGAARHRQLGNAGIRFFDADDPWLDELIEWCVDPKRLRMRATIEYQIEHKDRAVALMERAVLLAPRDAEGISSLGDLYIKVGRPALARETLERCLGASGTRVPAILDFANLSFAYRLEKQPRESLRVVQNGLRAHPTAFELYDELGVVLSELGQVDAAIAAFRKSLELNPAHADANFRLAIVLLGVERRVEAYSALQQVLVFKPDFPPALSLLGRLLIEDGRLNDAEQHLRTLYEAYPDVYEARYMLGHVELIRARAAEGAGNADEAERHYREGVLFDEKNAQLQAGLGVLLLVQGRVDQALAPLEAYRRLQPQNPQSALYLGQVYARLGRVDQARLILTEGAQQADRTGAQSTAEFCREILRRLP